jgi:shikimate dehydrogenase
MTEWFEWRDAPEGNFAVLGDPIHHSLSPKMHSAAYANLGLTNVYRAIRVPEHELQECLNHLMDLGYQGVNCTVPLKEVAFQCVTECDPIAARLRVVNTIDFSTLKGFNTDSPGFARTLADLEFSNKYALVLGAGGSSRAVLDALIQTGWEVALWNRTTERAHQLVKELGLNVAVREELVIDEESLIVNTTSASLNDGSLPIDNEWYNAADHALFYDIAYSQTLTPLMKQAQANGLRVKDGRQMLMEQGAIAFEIWLETPAPRLAMLEALA